MLDIRSGHIYFQGQYSLHFFPFVCNIFLVLFFALVVFLSNPLLVILFLQPLPGFQSYKEVFFPVGLYRRVRLLPLEPRLFLYCPHSTTLSFRLQFFSFTDHFLLMDPMRGTFVGFGFSPILLSGSSGIAVSSCSVLACPRFLVSTCAVFNFFRFICLFYPRLFSLRAS